MVFRSSVYSMGSQAIWCPALTQRSKKTGVMAASEGRGKERKGKEKKY
jgi:hypothetical protein